MVLKNILITGATGMVGRHIVAALQAAGADITVMSRHEPPASIAAAGWYEWDLTEWYDFENAGLSSSTFDAVIHAGACVPGPDPVSRRTMFASNVTATLCIGEWAAKCGLPLVYLSGAVVYRDSTATGITESDPVAPEGFGGFYRTTKLLGEQVLTSLSEDWKGLVVLRPSSVYGAGMAAGKMINRFLSMATTGETIEIAPPWHDEIDLVHAGDVAAATVMALEQASSGTFNVGGFRASIAGIAEACVNAANAGKVTRSGSVPEDETPTIRFGIDCAKAAAAFGYRPAIDLPTGLLLMRDGALLPPAGREG